MGSNANKKMSKTAKAAAADKQKKTRIAKKQTKLPVRKLPAPVRALLGLVPIQPEPSAPIQQGR